MQANTVPARGRELANGHSSPICLLCEDNDHELNRCINQNPGYPSAGASRAPDRDSLVQQYRPHYFLVAGDTRLARLPVGTCGLAEAKQPGMDEWHKDFGVLEGIARRLW